MTEKVKISLFQAKIIKKLLFYEKYRRTGTNLAKEFLKGRQYIYLNLRDLRDWGLLIEHKRGRNKFYDPTEKAEKLAEDRINLEIQKEKQAAEERIKQLEKKEVLEDEGDE